MFDNHANREKYFNEQALNTEKYIIPFIENELMIQPGLKILEIGCGEGGNLKPFIDRACDVTGIDLTESKIKNAAKFYPELETMQNVRFFHGDVYDFIPRFESQFDLIILKDTLEHIYGQEKLLSGIKKMLKPRGSIFIAFPPWEMPFGGHQQMCYSKFLALMPWIHLLPRFLYRGLLRLFKEPEYRINELFEVRDTRISIGRFLKICRQEGYTISKAGYYCINPNYEIKFGLKPRKLWTPLAKVPYLRNFLITTGYYLLKVRDV